MGTTSRPAPRARSAPPRSRRSGEEHLPGLESRDPKRRAAAEAALRKLGPAAAPALASFLVHARGRARKRAAFLLNLLGRPALPALQAQLARSSVEGRRRIVELAGHIIEPEAVPLLIAALTDAHHTVRERAARALLRRTAEDEVSLMLKAFRQGQGMQRQHLLEIFGVLRDPRISPLLLSTFSQVKTTLRRHNQLDCLLRRPAGYGQALQALASPDRKLRGAMLRALSYEVTSMARVAQRGWVRAEQGRFRAAFRGVRRTVLPALRAALRNRRPAVALAAARVLQLLGMQRSTRKQADAFIADLQRRIRTLDPKRFADQLVVHHARLGFLYWHRSCKRPDAQSLCMRTRRVKQRSGLPRLVRTFLPRDARLVAKARSEFRAAWRAWAGGQAAAAVPKDDPRRVRRVARSRHYAAWAQFMKAEVALESFLRDGVPTLDRPGAAVTNLAQFARGQLQAWYRRKLTVAKRLAATYHVAMTKVVAGTGHHRRASVYWRLASLSRVGTVYLELAHQVVRIRAPRWLRSAADRTAFEEAYLEVVDRFEKAAMLANRGCLQTAARKRYFWDLALHCEEAYMTADPDGYAAWAEPRRARLTRIPAPAASKRRLTLEELRPVVRSRRRRVQVCIRKHPPGTGASGGTLTVRFRIEVSGRVTVLDVTGLRNPGLHACVRRVYGAMRFPVGPPRPTEVSYPYHYQPGVTKIAF